MTRAGELAVPGDGVSGKLRTLQQRSHHVRLGNQRVNHNSGVVRIDGSHETPIAGPRVDLHFGETRAESFVGRASFASGHSSSGLADWPEVGFYQRGKCYAPGRLIAVGYDAIANAKRGCIRLQHSSRALEQIFPELVRGAANSRALQRNGPSAVPVVAGGRDVRIAPFHANPVARGESEHLRHQV